jgi:cytochrome c-type biogenesis protein CcmH/NrfF
MKLTKIFMKKTFRPRLATASGSFIYQNAYNTLNGICSEINEIARNRSKSGHSRISFIMRTTLGQSRKIVVFARTMVGIAALMLSGLAGSPQRALAASKTTAQEIEGATICQCSCQQTVSGCNHLGCGYKAEMQGMAEKEVASGKDNAAILQDFVLKYGTKVLATPAPTGFNLTVWILPILGGIVGLSAVVMMIRRWRHVLPAAPDTSPSAINPEAMSEVEEEMKRLG